MKFKKYLEDSFAASAFAEEGLDTGSFGFRRTLTMGELANSLKDLYAAVAFAEENCHDVAMEILQKKAARPALIRFLEDVGLTNVPVKLCVVNM